MKSSDPIDMSNQFVELLTTIKMCYSNSELASDSLDSTDVSFLTSVYNRMHCGILNAVNNLKGITLKKGLQTSLGSM